MWINNTVIKGYKKFRGKKLKDLKTPVDLETFKQIKPM